jgi:hypothetical protein
VGAKCHDPSEGFGAAEKPSQIACLLDSGVWALAMPLAEIQERAAHDFGQVLPNDRLSRRGRTLEQEWAMHSSGILARPRAAYKPLSSVA